jgi:hypothetical protein
MPITESAGGANPSNSPSNGQRPFEQRTTGSSSTTITAQISAMVGFKTWFGWDRTARSCGRGTRVLEDAQIEVVPIGAIDLLLGRVKARQQHV